MRFQFSYEGLSICSSLNFYWQLITDAWCSDGESTFAELQSRPPCNKVIVASRAVRSSARYRRCHFNQVHEVGGSSNKATKEYRKAKRKYERALINIYKGDQQNKLLDVVISEDLVYKKLVGSVANKAPGVDGLVSNV